MGQSDDRADDQPYTQADDLPNDRADARWMTFAELAAARGISKESAIALVRRKRWRRQRDNRGHVIALVPYDGPELRRATPGEADHRPDDRADYRPHTEAFETALAVIEAAHASEIGALRGQLDSAEQGRLAAQALADRALAGLADAEARVTTERGRADQAEGDRRAAEVRAERAEVAIAGERQRADALRERAEAARAETQEALQALDEIRRADDVRKARGRLRRAWEGWRGR